MATSDDWIIPEQARPEAADCAFDLSRALSGVVGLSARIPEDAFTAGILGTERAGHGVVIRDGLVLTIGYLITEAEEIFLTTSEGRVVPGHPLAYDFVTGFGLVQALGKLGAPPLALGSAGALDLGDPIVVGAAGGAARSLAARLVAREEFAGYWEYLLDEALFTAPAHPVWGGAAFIGPDGALVGVGSLQLQAQSPRGPLPINMAVPIDLLPPILDDLVKRGRADRPPRPWLGLYAIVDDGVEVMSVAPRSPADKAGLETGDKILAVGNKRVRKLEDFYRALWALGPAGVVAPLKLRRGEETFTVEVRTAARESFLKGPKLH